MGHALDTIITERWWEDVGLNGLLDKAENEAMTKKPQRQSLARKARPKSEPFVMHRMIRADSVVRLTGAEPFELVERALAARVDNLLSCEGRISLSTKLLNSSIFAEVTKKAEECVQTGSGHFTEASGDFQLMTREAWWRVRGYAERNTYAHFDSALMYTVKALGFKLHGHFRSTSDPSRFYFIWHQGHAEGGYLARVSAYGAIETPFWKYMQIPLWGYEDRKEWGMPRHHFKEVVWLKGKKQEPVPAAG
jgi:hypothetical protein